MSQTEQEKIIDGTKNFSVPTVSKVTPRVSTRQKTYQTEVKPCVGKHQPAMLPRPRLCAVRGPKPPWVTPTVSRFASDSSAFHVNCNFTKSPKTSGSFTLQKSYDREFSGGIPRLFLPC
ncbi:hypothetical protein RRG08_052821 [Elysia crispata]|uniref:Uncharacterized protein n=1 Tax=Elysia crispata TaxID=231223 RepID=A0AAE1B6B1_9GAST|nr:hypothetical protein RRG08_052821 [Elysia crispata]